MVSILGTNKQLSYKCKTAHDHLTVKKHRKVDENIEFGTDC